MTQISSSVNNEVLIDFRKVIFYKYGLKKGDFKKALEEALLDYIKKNDSIIKK